MSERLCIRNCTQRDVHYATCTTSGPEWADREDRCRGCAPRVCRDGSLICDRCFGIMSRLLADTPDLLGRLRSRADPLKATPTDNLRTGSRGILEAQPPVPVDLLDAIGAYEDRDWYREQAEAAITALRVPVGEGEQRGDVSP